MTALLAARDVTVGHTPVPVLHGLSMQVEAGEVVAVLGPNGAGKSTTLMALAGCLRPMSGCVEWLGAPTDKALHRRVREGLRYVPEGRSVVRSLSTLDNLRLGPGPVGEALDMFPELEPLLGRGAGLLSGGEQQMLALARAMAGQPRVVLVDEVSLGLAPLIVNRLLQAIREASTRGIGVVLVEQQIRSALKVADRGYVLHRGRVAIEGTAEELLARSDEIEVGYLAARSGGSAADAEATGAPSAGDHAGGDPQGLDPRATDGHSA